MELDNQQNWIRVLESAPLFEHETSARVHVGLQGDWPSVFELYHH